MKKIFEQMYLYMNPFILLDSEKLRAEWSEVEKRKFVRRTSWLLSIGALAYILHYPFVDLAAGKEPRELWLVYRSGMMIVALLALLWYRTKRLGRARFFKTPAFIAFCLFNYFQGQSMIWYQATPFFFSLVMASTLSVIIGDSMLTSLGYFSLFIGLQIHPMISSNVPYHLIVSYTMMFYGIVILLSSRFKYEVQIFVSERKVIDLALQVSHDIRSPLSALNMAIAGVYHLFDEQKQLITGATRRINDIANDLLKKSRKKGTDQINSLSEAFQGDGGLDEFHKVQLSSVVANVVSEKKIQFKDRTDVGIFLDAQGFHDVVVVANETDLCRVLSNLINNSVEAIDGKQGQITVSIRRYKNKAVLAVADNGKGIPENFLKDLNLLKTLSRGKGAINSNSGHGLGIEHAHTTVKNWGGDLRILSQEKVGTTVEIIFPLGKTS